MAPSVHDARIEWTLTALVVLGAACFYLAVQRGTMVGWDGRVMAGIARNIWEHGSVKMYRDSFGSHPLWRHEFPYGAHGIGMSLMLAPLWALQRHVHGAPTDAIWLTVANPVLLAATAGMVLRIGLAVGFTRRIAVAAAAVFALLTMAPHYSTELFSEPAVTFATTLAVLGCLRWGEGRPAGPWYVGAGIATAILFRTDAVPLLGIVLLAVPLFVPARRLRATAREWLPVIVVPNAAALAVTAWYNEVRFGSLLRNRVSQVGFTNPLLSGLYRQLLSPGKGFFWYDPILLLGLPGIWLLFRRNRPLAITITGLCVVRVVVYSKWPWPDGSVAWGPRFLLPLCPLLALGVGEALMRIDCLDIRRRMIAWRVVAGLVMASALVVLASLWVGYDQIWGDVNTPPPGTPLSQLNQVKEAQVWGYYETIGGSNIVRSLRTLDHAEPFPLRHFAGGPSPFGVVMLLGFAASAVGAIALARAGDRLGHRAPVPSSVIGVSREDGVAYGTPDLVADYSTSHTPPASMSDLRSPGP